MRALIPLLIAVAVGGLSPLQGALNSRVGKALHPLQATLVSLVVSLLAVLLLLLFQPQTLSLSQLKTVPWYYYLGGLAGVVYITAMLMLAPAIGVGNMVIAVVTGQVILSLFLDHFGLLGLERQPINAYRVAGSLGIIVSLVVFKVKG